MLVALMDLEPVKGTRDFLPKEKMLRDYVERSIKEVFESFGFSPLQTPALENWEVLSAKYAGGAEILKETYKLTDQGNRELGLRYDQTVPTCRIIASNPRMTMPFKRYQIQAVFRDGPMKVGRYREFYQCDIDTFGVESVSADAEILAASSEVFSRLGIGVVLKLNNRKVMDGLLDLAGVEQGIRDTVILSLDKLEKIGAEEVAKEMEQKGVGKDTAKKVLKFFFDLDGLGNKEAIAKLSEMLTSGEGKDGVVELADVLKYLELFGADMKSVKIEPSLARGLSYYTGPVFEFVPTSGPIKSSVAGGGRWDEMVGKFSGGQKVPATGIALGFEVICEVLKAQENKFKANPVEAFVIPIKGQKEGYGALNSLRKSGVKCAVDLNMKGVGKALEYCSKQEIPFAVIVGEKEAAEGKVTLRDLTSGKEEMLTAAQASKKIIEERERKK